MQVTINDSCNNIASYYVEHWTSALTEAKLATAITTGITTATSHIAI